MGRRGQRPTQRTIVQTHVALGEWQWNRWDALVYSPICNLYFDGDIYGSFEVLSIHESNKIHVYMAIIDESCKGGAMGGARFDSWDARLTASDS